MSAWPASFPGSTYTSGVSEEPHQAAINHQKARVPSEPSQHLALKIKALTENLPPLSQDCSQDFPPSAPLSSAAIKLSEDPAVVALSTGTPLCSTGRTG